MVFMLYISLLYVHFSFNYYLMETQNDTTEAPRIILDLGVIITDMKFPDVLRTRKNVSVKNN
jgi:hypothetical protein